MTGEAQDLAYRWNAESSPPRHRVHRDHPSADEDGSDFILRALRVSVVEIHAKQSQFAAGVLPAGPAGPGAPNKANWRRGRPPAPVQTKPIWSARRRTAENRLYKQTQFGQARLTPGDRLCETRRARQKSQPPGIVADIGSGTRLGLHFFDFCRRRQTKPIRSR